MLNLPDPSLREISEIIPGKLYLSGANPLLCRDGYYPGVTKKKFDGKIIRLGNFKCFDGYIQPADITIVVYDDPRVDITPHLKRTYNLIDTWIKEKHKVLVHCRAGVSRSSSVVIYYLMKKYNIKLFEALAFVRKKRPIVNPNEGFTKILANY